MIKKFIITLCLLAICNPLLSKTINITDDLYRLSIAKHIEYYEDTTDKTKINDIKNKNIAWQKPAADEFNFGFTNNPYWFRFTVNNTTENVKPWYLEISYPMLDSVKLYIPEGDSRFKKIETGDHLPFHNRDVKERNFIFSLSEKPGKHTYYIRIKTTSSLNFPVIIWSSEAYLEKLFKELPILWIYYGLMMIMVIYNLFIYISARDKSYIFYALFISSWILFQLTLNGLAFQYLWPESVWWANNCLPIFMALIAMWNGFLFREYLQTARNFKRTHKFINYGVIIPSSIVVLITCTANYSISIKVATFNSLYFAIGMLIISFILTMKGSRPGLFYFVAFAGNFIGIGAYTLKTFGVLPSNFFTNWSVQIGSSMVVVLLSLGLADKINTMRKEMQDMNRDLENKEKNAKKRAEYLEGVVTTVNIISGELTNVSNELSNIGTGFTNLSQEQAATSEEMSATFEELTAANENIHKTTVAQEEEGQKTKDLASILNGSQTMISNASESVLQSILVILESTQLTEDTLKQMIEKMNVINEGGRSVSNFIDMINDITDRINLLSLNAAIEAARAGDYGRGFSVVSDEIGKLASATSDNSQEISSQMTKIIRDIEDGTGIVNKTKDAINVTFRMVSTINEKLDEVKSMMNKQDSATGNLLEQTATMDSLSKNISVAVNEQNTSMNETLKSIERVSQIAQEIAMANKKIMDFTNSINNRSVDLNNLVKDMRN